MKNGVVVKRNHLLFFVIIAFAALLVQYVSGYGTGQPDVLGHTADEIELPSDFPLVPSGAVMAFAGLSCPEGWLEANGLTVSSSTYPDLYAAIGTIYGGSGGNFNLPDYRGYFMRGWDHGVGVDPDSSSRTDRGDGVGGNVVGSVQDDEFESHFHYYGAVSRGGTGSGTGGGIAAKNYQTTESGGSETRPMNIYVLYCIRS